MGVVSSVRSLAGTKERRYLRQYSGWTIQILRRPFVAMMQTTESRERNYLGATERASSPVRRFLIQSQVSSIVMVVRDIIRDKPPQMALVRRNHVIQQISSTTSNPAFRHSILPGTANCCVQRFNTDASNCCRHLESVLRIVVQDEVIRIRNVRECFAQLLRDPVAGQVRCDAEVQDAPAVVGNDKKAIEDVNVIVGTVKKSMAAMPSRWLRRNANQR